RRTWIARLDVSPRAWIDRRVELSFPRFSRHAHGGTVGNGSRDGAEPGNRGSGYRGQRAADQGRGSRTERFLRHGAKGQEVAMPSVDIIDLSNKKVGSLELADAVF